MKINRLLPIFTLMSVSVAVFIMAGSTKAFAATKTWTGAGIDNNISTPANWGGVAPIAGDDLVFPANSTKLTVVNDLAGNTVINSVVFSGIATQPSNYTLSGNALTILSGVSQLTTGSSYFYLIISAPVTLGAAQSFNAGTSFITFTNINTASFSLSTSGYVDINGAVTGSGNITISSGKLTLGSSGDNSAYTGAIITSSGATLDAFNDKSLGSATAGTTINAGGLLQFCNVSIDRTIAEPIVLNSNGTSPAISTVATGCGQGGAGAPTTNATVTATGSVTLNGNVIYSGYYSNLRITGTYTNNAHTFSVLAGTSGVLTLPSGAVLPDVVTTPYAANSPATSIFIYPNNIAVVTGTYSDTYVSGGTLKGTGTVGIINMDSGAVAPGMSPGCLASSGLAFTGGEYQAELGGTTACTEYDQLKVTGTVDLGANVTTLTTSLYNNYKPVVGASYTIIDNDASDAVTGTFKNLAEGATFTLSGYVFKISYIGGTGNDVVLTVVSVPAPAPTVPNTGFRLITSSPIATVVGTLLLAGGAYTVSKRYAQNLK